MVFARVEKVWMDRIDETKKGNKVEGENFLIKETDSL